MSNDAILMALVAVFGGGLSVWLYKFFFPHTSEVNKKVEAAKKEQEADTIKVEKKAQEVATMEEDLNTKLKELASDNKGKDVTLQKIAETLKTVEARKSMSESEIKTEYEKQGFKVEDF